MCVYSRDLLKNVLSLGVSRHPNECNPHRLDDMRGEWLTASQVKAAARTAGLDVRFARGGWGRLSAYQSLGVVIATYDDGRSEFWTGLHEKDVQALVPDGDDYRTERRTRADARARGWRKEVVLVAAAPRPRAERFDLGWFLREAFARSPGGRWVLFLSVAVTVFALALPLFFQVVVDKVLGVRAASTLQALLVGVTAVVLLEVLGRYTRDRLLNRAAELVDVRLGVWSFRHLLSLPLSFFETRPAGVLAKHMQQGDQAREFVTRTVVGGGLDLLTVVLFLPLLFWYSVPLAAVVAGGAVLMGAVIGGMIVPFNRRLEAVYAAEARRQALLVETLRALPGVKAAAAETPLLARYEAAIAATAEGNCRLMNLSEGAQAAVRGLEKLLTVAVVGAGAWLYFDRHLTIGQLVAVQMLAHHVTGPVMRLVEAVYQFQRVRLAVRMLAEVMNTPPEPLLSGPGLRPRLTGEIVVDRVSFRYPSAPRLVLDGFSLHVAAGEVVAVTGPSGCGKSTLLRLLLGFDRPTAGRILYAGEDGRWYDLAELDVRWVRASVGTVLQTTEFLSDTVHANIALARPDTPRAAVQAAAVAAGAGGFVPALSGAADPDTGDARRGYDARLNEAGVGLSGGQRQRLGIARALVADPVALFLDEPTSALDDESERQVVETLAALVRQKARTLVVVTHRPALLSLPGCREVWLPLA